MPGAPDNAANCLATRRLRIEDPAGVVSADDSLQAHKPEVGIDADLGKDGREAEDRLGPRRLLDRVVVAVPYQARTPVAGEQLRIGDLVQIYFRERKFAVDDDHVLRRRSGKRRIGRPVSASSIAFSRAARAASMTAAVALAVVADPMAGCDSGSRVSPSRTVTLSGSKPSASAATCAIVV